jgi:lauroyl/myristoyl acyltransferase
MEYYAAIKTKIMSVEGKWVKQKGWHIKQNKSDSKRQILHVFYHVWNVESSEKMGIILEVEALGKINRTWEWEWYKRRENGG